MLRPKGRVQAKAPLPILRPGMNIPPMSRADSRVVDTVLAPPGQNGFHTGESRASSRFSLHSWQGVALISGGVIVLAGAVLAGFLLFNKDATVFIVDNGVKSEYRTYAKTVQSLLSAAKVTVGAQDELTPEMTAPITNGLEVAIYRAFAVTVTSEDRQLQLTMTHGKVRDAIAKAGITLAENDLVMPALDAELTPGMKIEHYTVQIQSKTETESIAYKTVTKKDPWTPTGKDKLETAGANGVKTITYKQYFRNGVLLKQEVASTKVTKKPVDKVILKGTGHPLAIAIRKDTRITTAPKPSQIIATKVATYCTAYTHSGHRTSRGTLPRPGTIAADPKQIPYGTKLYIPGYGYGVMEDTGSMRHRPSELDIDLFMNTTSQCNQWGRKRGFTFYIVSTPNIFN